MPPMVAVVHVGRSLGNLGRRLPPRSTELAIVKGNAEIRSADGSLVGRGMTYLHLPRGQERAQTAGGTVSCTDWNPNAGPPRIIAIENGPTLSITVSKEAISQCSQNHILRYTTEWNPDASSSAAE